MGHRDHVFGGSVSERVVELSCKSVEDLGGIGVEVDHSIWVEGHDGNLADGEVVIGVVGLSIWVVEGEIEDCEIIHAELLVVAQGSHEGPDGGEGLEHSQELYVVGSVIAR